MRALPASRIATVSGFLKILTTVIEFGANAEGVRTLAAMKQLPRLLDGHKKKVAEADIGLGLVTGSWKRLVFKSLPEVKGVSQFDGTGHLRAGVGGGKAGDEVLRVDENECGRRVACTTASSRVMCERARA